MQNLHAAPEKEKSRAAPLLTGVWEVATIYRGIDAREGPCASRELRVCGEARLVQQSRAGRGVSRFPL